VESSGATLERTDYQFIKRDFVVSFGPSAGRFFRMWFEVECAARDAAPIAHGERYVKPNFFDLVKSLALPAATVCFEMHRDL
jgi:hypothetical protein